MFVEEYEKTFEINTKDYIEYRESRRRYRFVLFSQKRKK